MFPLEAVINATGRVIDKIFPDPILKQEAMNKLEELKLQGDLRFLQADLQVAENQTKVNLAEATSGSTYASSWRPTIGYICAIALAYNFIIYPLFVWVAALYAPEIKAPQLESGSLMELVIGMLGLAGFRTYEKVRGAR